VDTISNLVKVTFHNTFPNGRNKKEEKMLRTCAELVITKNMSEVIQMAKAKKKELFTEKDKQGLAEKKGLEMGSLFSDKDKEGLM